MIISFTYQITANQSQHQKNIERYHKNCNFVMTCEACLTLERLIEIKQLKKSSNFNFWIAIISILLGVAAQIPDWINFLKPSNMKSGQSEQVNLNPSETTKETLKSKPCQYQNHPTQQNYDKTKKDDFDSNNTNSNQLKPNDKKSVTK